MDQINKSKLAEAYSQGNYKEYLDKLLTAKKGNRLQEMITGFKYKYNLARI